MKVLLVDDSTISREIQRGVLEQLGCSGCEIAEASCGEEGLSRLRTDDPKIVIVDATMPDMDGTAFLGRARASGYSHPIVLLSSESQGRRVRGALDLGAADYIVKPFTPDLFSQRIEELVGDRLQQPLL